MLLIRRKKAKKVYVPGRVVQFPNLFYVWDLVFHSVWSGMGFNFLLFLLLDFHFVWTLVII